MHTPKTFLYILGYFSFDYLMHAQIDKTKTKHANQHDILKKKTKRKEFIETNKNYPNLCSPQTTTNTINN